MPKRRRTHGNDEGKDQEELVKKRRRMQFDVDHHGDGNEEDNPYEELFTAVMTATDNEGRSLSTMFQLLPSKVTVDGKDSQMDHLTSCRKVGRSKRQQKSRYPEYYKVIHDPIDLKMIATKIQNNSYQTLTEFERDLLLMVKNAKTFNEPGSQIYKDAAALRKVIINKKTEIDQRRSLPAKISERIRARRMASGQKWSAITAALQYESDFDDRGSNTPSYSSTGIENMVEESNEAQDEGNESGPDDADTNPQWQLYETVKNYQKSPSHLLSEPFQRLPSRRSYPDYYKEIKQPISLFKIRTKIKTGQYNSTMDVVDDMNLMFENARKYNRPESKIYKDSDSDDDDERTPKRKGKKGLFGSLWGDTKRRRTFDFEFSMKKRMKYLYKSLIDYTDESGRPLITMFMEKPSKKDYPDYYEIITNPIDMKTIETNIKLDKYLSEESLILDFKLMFNNCRQYNEEGSQIYRDAETLERILLERIRDLGPLSEIHKSARISGKRTITELAREDLYVKKSRNTYLKQKLKTLYDTIREYTDNKNRKLSTIFMKLPSKTEYPDYYEVIKRPLDMDRIGNRMKTGQYDSLEDMLSDFVLMFDNACKYNEPDSQIYKDALTLQRIALQTKLELSEDNQDGVPDVKALVQELLTNLFISVYNHQDEEGRCYSDSLVELSETDTSSDPQCPMKKPLSLDIIKRRLDKGRYKRLDTFQDDVFEVFEHARNVSRTDSQVFEDSIELQSYFIRMRDELCRFGEVLQSPALKYRECHLQSSVEALKAEKLPREQQEAELEPKQEKDESTEISTADSMTFKGMTYYIGDFVYIEPREKGMEPHIMHIEKLWRDNQSEQWIYGCWFYRPNETFHLATRKFLQKELFKSDNHNSAPLSQVMGKCYVMFVKDYFKYRPEGFDDKDIYVCESRYSAKAKAFKKIKVWGFTPNNYVSIVVREEPLNPIRVPSVFKDGVEKPKDEGSDIDDNDLVIVEKPRPNIICEVQNPEDGAVYYEQYSIPAGTFKLGDYCYVRTEHIKSLIGRIDRMWVNKEGVAFFHGPWFITPQEVHHPPTRLFYKQEVFLSSIEDTNPLLSVIARCAVLDLKDYITRRVTEIPEQDVYICESRYLEAERQIRKLPKGLKKFNLSHGVTDDEYYYFRKPVNPQKELSPLMPKMNSETDNEDSNDQPPSCTPKDEQVFATPSSSKKKTMKRLVTGYILFASEVRKSVVAANPDRSFGEISRMIGTEWRNLPAAQKAEYEDRAQKQNEENAAKEGFDSLPHSPASAHGDSGKGGNPEKGENMVYECQWEGCDYQFEDHQDLIDHLITEPNGHVHISYQNAKENEFQCLWQNCTRIKKNVPPFPNMQRLVRHCKEVHLKAAAKCILPDNRSRNFVPSRRSSPGTSGPNSNIPAYAPGMFPGHPSNYHPGMPYNTHVTQSNTGMTLPYVSQGYSIPSPNIFHIPNPAPKLPYPTLSHVPFFFTVAPNTARSASLYNNPKGIGTWHRTPDPIFISSPPRAQRLLHSTTYIKYIEGLQAENKHISNWDAQLKATRENTTLSDVSRLPIHWLANGAGNHGNVVNALWALRDFMLKDALNISKIL
ncbi:protein polybromo-1 isoform X3 [Centruroides vittatus]|uniref:protein polybromo-1 isoform X3 n=1 Tax=Centruroides vittatus TaxID=120091 RepID=UPI00351073FE